MARDLSDVQGGASPPVTLFQNVMLIMGLFIYA